MTMTREDRDHLWDHFKFNADQRIKAFNFFVVLSGFANGAVFAAYEKKFALPLLAAIGVLIIVLALVFAVIDQRSRNLTRLSVPGLKQFEAECESLTSDEFKVFTMDAKNAPLLVRYTTAFSLLYCVQAAFGVAVVLYAAGHISF
jgi:hypothetical protein